MRPEGTVALATTYRWRVGAVSRGETSLPRQIAAWWTEPRLSVVAVWKERLSQPRADLSCQTLVEAIVREGVQAWKAVTSSCEAVKQ